MVARAVLTKDRKTLAGKGGATRKNYFGMSRLASHTTRRRLFRPDPSAWLSLQQQFQRTARKASSELGSHHSKRIALGCPGPASNSAESQRDRGAASSSEAARVSLKKPFLSRLVALNVAQRALSLLGSLCSRPAGPCGFGRFWIELSFDEVHSSDRFASQ